MGDQDLKSGDLVGARAVRALFLDRLTDAGLARKRGVSAAAHEATLRRLGEALAYLGADNLATLAEVILDDAADGLWPSEVYIRSAASALQPRPPEEKRIVTSWFASLAGPRAEEEGHLVEMFRYLRRKGRPPQAYDLRALGDEARANARRLELIDDRLARDTASAEDQAWRQAYLADRARALALVAEGRARRGDGGQGDAA